MKNKITNYKNLICFKVPNVSFFILLTVAILAACSNASPVFAQSINGTVNILSDSPEIISITADDPSNSAPGFSSGDTITILFSVPTNTPGGNGTQSKTAVDSLFSFPGTFDTATYTGQWVSTTTFVITISDVGNANPQIGDFRITAIGNITNTSGTSSVSTTESPPLEGSFGVPAPITPPTVSSSVSGGGGGGGGGRTGVSVGGTTSGSSEGGFGGILKPTDELTAPPKLPTWVRNVAGWWSLGIISEQYFTQGVKYMIKEKFVMVDDETFDSPHLIHVPPWTKRVAGWWAEGKISDMEYFRFVQWLVNHNIMPRN